MADFYSANTAPAYEAKPPPFSEPQPTHSAPVMLSSPSPLQQPQQWQWQTYQTALPLFALQDAPAPVDCPVCRQRALTVTEKTSGNTTHLWAALSCFVLCLGCIPYLIPGLKDVRHKCGNCGVMLAEWHKSGRTVVLQHA